MRTLAQHLNDACFDGRLSPRVLAELRYLDGERAEVRQFVERQCRLFAAAGIDATDVPVAWGCSVRETIPNVLPGAWGGMVPSITWPNRHVRIDRYLAGNRWMQPASEATLLDLGCG